MPAKTDGIKFTVRGVQQQDQTWFPLCLRANLTSSFRPTQRSCLT